MPDLKKTTESKSISSRFYSKVSFDEAWALQRDLLAAIPFSPRIIGLEHPAVITLGHRAQAESEIRPENTIPVVKIDRGGLATLHSEGQLVIYPVIRLADYSIGVRSYVDLLLQTTVVTLETLYGIRAKSGDDAVGLFTSVGKIAFCGVKIKNGITQHGLSINLKNDLNLFKNIVACGSPNPQLDRVANYVEHCDLELFFNHWVKEFRSRLIAAAVV